MTAGAAAFAPRNASDFKVTISEARTSCKNIQPTVVFLLSHETNLEWKRSY